MKFEYVSMKVIRAYLNLHEVSSLKNKKETKKRKYAHKRKMQEARKKLYDLINKNLRHFPFSRAFFRSESESKTPATSETGLFVTLANG